MPHGTDSDRAQRGSSLWNFLGSVPSLGREVMSRISLAGVPDSGKLTQSLPNQLNLHRSVASISSPEVSKQGHCTEGVTFAQTMPPNWPPDLHALEIGNMGQPANRQNALEG